MSHADLAEYYSLNFSLFQYHKYPIDWIESLIPFERDLYVQMLMQHLQEEKNKK